MYIKQFRERIKELSKLIKSLEPKLSEYPAGNLRIMKSKKNLKFFYVTEKGDNHGKYIRKQDEKLVKQLAEKNYWEKIVKEAKREKAAMESFIKGMEGTAPEDVYDSLSEYRREIVEPVIISDKMFADNWEKEDYQGNPYKAEELIYPTKKGGKVRTKSEAMLADMYYELGIPYRYECPFILRDGRVKYPDFTLLKLPERKVVYHEHMGLLEDEAYRKANLIKLQDYCKSGLYCCDNLIITYETEYVPLNINDIKNMIKKTFFSN